VSKKALEEQANLLLYGHRHVCEVANQPEMFTLLGGGAPKRVHLSYREPSNHPFYGGGVCSECGRKRYEGGIGLCRFCYRSRAQSKFQERSPFIEYFLERQDTSSFDGVQMQMLDPINRDPLDLLIEAEGEIQ
jgi:ribosomal protein S14